MKDIFVDTNRIRLYGVAKDPVFKVFFTWLFKKGTLTCSQKLLVEYGGINSDAIASLIDHLIREGRLDKHPKKIIESVDDAHFHYLSNKKDRWHVKTVMCSRRKLCLAFDSNFVRDVKAFPRHRAQAASKPNALPYN